MANDFQKAFRYGIDQPTENVATTLEALGFDTQAKELRDLIEAPEDYESAAARFINPEGEWYDYNWSELPLATVEQAGQLGGSILSRIGGAGIGAGAGSLVGPGGTAIGGIIGAFLGPTLFEAVQVAGPVAFERARNNGREEPNAEDWAGALGTAGFSGVLNAIGIKNIGLLNSTVGKTLKAGAREGVTETGQGFTEQIGGTGLTAAGLQIDPKAAIGEGLIGTSSGTSIQAPIAGAQALGNLQEEIVDSSIKNAMLEQPTPDEAVDQMDETINPNLAIVEDELPTEVNPEDSVGLALEGLAEFEETASVNPSGVGFTSENVQEFLSSQERYVKNLIETNFGHRLDSDTRFNIFVDAQRYIKDHFELFDPRNPDNNPQQIVQRIAQTIRTEGERYTDQADLSGAKGDIDPRFIGENAAVLDPQAKEQVYEKPSYRRTGITTLERGIDPMYMTQSILVQDRILEQRLAKDPKKPMNPETVLQQLGIRETDDNWFEVINREKQGNKAIADEAINLEIAPFLKAKKDAGEMVTKEEIENVLYNSLNRYYDFDTKGYDTQHSGGHTFRSEGLERLFPDIDNVEDNYWESWLHYEPIFPENEILSDSVYQHRDGGDQMHSPHGDGALMWMRGYNVQHPEGLGSGKLLAESQSKLHGHAQDTDPNKKETYLSKITSLEEASPELEDTKNKLSRFRYAREEFVEEVKEKQNWRNMTPNDAKDVANLLIEDVLEDVLQDQSLYNVSNFVESELTSLSSEFAERNGKLNNDYNKNIAFALVDKISEQQPFETIGITINEREFQNYVDTPQNTFNAKDGKGRKELVFDYLRFYHDFDIEAARFEDSANELGNIHDDVVDMAFNPDDAIEEQYATDRKELVKNYIPVLTKRYRTVAPLLAEAANYPTADEVKTFQDYEKDRKTSERNVVPDFPMKENWPAMNVRRMVAKAVDDGDNFIFISTKGYGGAPPSVYIAQKAELKKISKVIASYRADLKADDLLKELPKSKSIAGGPYFALDIRPLRQLILAGVFKGFKGYKKGGLVTKAQGAGYSMNYGDYGRSYR